MTAKFMLTSVVAALLAGVTGCGQSNELRNPKLKLYSIKGDTNEFKEVLPGGEIPYHVGTGCYGWKLTFDPVPAQVELDELLLLPDKAQEWGTTKHAVIADDGMSSRSKIVVSGQKGTAAKSWCVAPGDPLGAYKFVIAHRNATVGEVSFQLVR